MDSPSSSRLYPHLEDLEDEENDPLSDLGAPKPKRPPRPPPPRRANTTPTQLGNQGQSLRSRSPQTSAKHSPSLTLDPRDTILILPPPLFPHEVRWFYQEKGKFWQPFNGYDSLALEEAHRRLEEGQTSAGECEVPVLGNLYEVHLTERLCKPIYWTGKESLKILRGCWFEVQGEKWYPVEEQDYCMIEEEHCNKGWRERARADAELQAWAVAGAPGAQQQTDGGTKTQQQKQQPSIVVLHKATLEKYDVLWLGDKEIIKMKKEISTQLWNKVGEKLGKGQTYGGTKMVRGYKEPALGSDREAPVGHLVFVIHGIGQNMDVSNIVKSTSELRETCTQVAKKHFPDQWKEKRVEFLPVEWRTWLTLDKGLLAMITPHGVRMLRGLLNDSVLDVMYYTSAKYGPEMLDGLRFALHKQLALFTSRHPSFFSDGGTVSIFAHSLGSVMTYDLLRDTCIAEGIMHEEPMDYSPSLRSIPSSSVSSSASGPRAVEVSEQDCVRFISGLQSPDSSLDPLSLFQESGAGGDGMKEDEGEKEARLELEQLKQRVAEIERRLGTRKEEEKPRGLKFKVDHFFAVGSPLAVFIMMREHEAAVKRGHRSAASLLPTCVCKRIHNIHHPSDPVAYRLEPLVNPLYAQVKPMKADSSGSKPSKEAVDHAEGPKTEMEKATAQAKSWLSSLWGSSVKQASPASKPKVPEKLMDTDKSLQAEDKLKERLDIMLRESFTENSYLNSLTAHTSYWTSSDCATYVLLQIYKFKKPPE